MADGIVSSPGSPPVLVVPLARSQRSSTTTGSESSCSAELLKCICPNSEDVDSVFLQFDSVSVELLSYALSGSPFRPSSFPSVFVDCCVSAVASPPLRLALINIGYRGVKRVLDAMWVALFGSYRCDFSDEVVSQEVTVRESDSSRRGAAQRCLVGTDSAAGSSSYFGSVYPPASSSVSRPSTPSQIPGQYTEDGPEHITSQNLSQLEELRIANVRSSTHSIRARANYSLLRKLHSDLFTGEYPVSTGISAPLISISKHPSPHPPPPQRDGEPSYHRRSFAPSSFGSAISPEPSVLRTTPALYALARATDETDDKGASLRHFTQEGVQRALGLVFAHYHLSATDVKALFLMFLCSIAEVCHPRGQHHVLLLESTAGEETSESAANLSSGVATHFSAWFEKAMMQGFATAVDVLNSVVVTCPPSAIPLEMDIIATQLFRFHCPMRTADPAALWDSMKTPTLFSEALALASNYVLHSTQTVELDGGNGSDTGTRRWCDSVKVWSMRTRLVTMRGHFLYVYGSVASTSHFTEHVGEVGGVAPYSKRYDSPIAVINLSRASGSNVYLVSGRHDVEFINIRAPGLTSQCEERPPWANNGERSSSKATPVEMEVLRTYDARHEIQLLTFLMNPNPESSTPHCVDEYGSEMFNREGSPFLNGQSMAFSSPRRSESSFVSLSVMLSPSSPSSQVHQWLTSHRYKTVEGQPIRQRVYPIRILCGKELHHFIFQSPGIRARWYQLLEEYCGNLHNAQCIETLVRAFCSLSLYIRNRIPYPVGPGAFESLAMLGAGTYGHVLLVRHKLTRKLFAMKVVQKRNFLTLRSIIEVRRENSILQGLDCPYIMKLHATYQTDACVYFLLDFLSGGDLLKHIQSAPERYLSESTSRFIIAEVAIALEYLRVRGIIHRDLKGDNLVMDSEGHIVLTDFGFAKKIAADPSGDGGHGGSSHSSTFLTNSAVAQSSQRSLLRHHLPVEEPFVVIPQHNRCGTVAYIAPEVLSSHYQGTGYGMEVDWWSLGVVFFTLLTGLFPFFKETTKDTTHEILHSAVRFPHDMRGGKDIDLSPEAKDLVLRLLEKKPEKRLSRLSELKAHPFFRNFDWKACEEHRVPPSKMLHVDLYLKFCSAKEANERLKARVEWAADLQRHPPLTPPLTMVKDSSLPYKTSDALAAEFDKHSKEMEKISAEYGIATPRPKQLESDIFHPVFARQERCGSDRDITNHHLDSFNSRGTSTSTHRGVEGPEDELKEDYIPHVIINSTSLGATSTGDLLSTTNCSIVSAMRSIKSPTGASQMGQSETAPFDIPFALSEAFDSVDGTGGHGLMDPIFDDFDESAYENMGLKKAQFTQIGETSLYRPYQD